MPLADPFRIRVDTLRLFMELPPLRLLALQCPPDLGLLARKLLKALDDDPDFPHLFLVVEEDFVDYDSFFRGLTGEVDRQARAAAPALADLGIDVPTLPELPKPVEGEDLEPLAAAKTVAAYLSEVAVALGDDVGVLCLVVSPGRVGQSDAYRWALAALAEHLTTDWCKLIALDDTGGVETRGLQGWYPRAMELDLAVSPEEIAAEVDNDLAGADSGAPELSDDERRRHLLLAGAMATSHGDLDTARTRLTEAARAATAAGARGDEANAHFNLGNVELEAHRYEAASEHFVHAAGIALESGFDPLAAMALTNLGVSLHREGRGEEALDAFGGAWELFDALDFRPGQAHVLDCTARAYRSGGDHATARRIWGRAGEIYDSIGAPHLRALREGGKAQVLTRLAELDAEGSI